MHLTIEPAEILGSMIDPRGGPGPFEGRLVGQADIPGTICMLGRSFKGPGEQFISATFEFRGTGTAPASRLRLLPTLEVEYLTGSNIDAAIDAQRRIAFVGDLLGVPVDGITEEEYIIPSD